MQMLKDRAAAEALAKDHGVDAHDMPLNAADALSVQHCYVAAPLSDVLPHLQLSSEDSQPRAEWIVGHVVSVIPDGRVAPSHRHCPTDYSRVTLTFVSHSHTDCHTQPG
jgi:hypothetical protein